MRNYPICQEVVVIGVRNKVFVVNGYKLVQYNIDRQVISHYSYELIDPTSGVKLSEFVSQELLIPKYYKKVSKEELNSFLDTYNDFMELGLLLGDQSYIEKAKNLMNALKSYKVED